MTLTVPSLETIQRDIRCRIEEILQPLINIPIQHDDAPFEKPINKPWLRATIRIAIARNVDIGTVRKTIRTTGILFFNIFTPINEGDLNSTTIVDKILGLFSGQSSGQVTYRSATTRDRVRDGSEWMVNMQCPFMADQIG